MQTTKIFYAFFILIITLSACKKENYTDWSIAENTLNAQEIILDIFVQAQYLNQSYYSYFTENCATINWQSSKEYVLDFGAFCFGYDARMRAGKWFLTINAPQTNRNTNSMSIFLEDYDFNKFIINGEIIVEFDSQENNKEFSIIANALKITTPENKTFIWSCNNNIQQIKGNDTAFSNANNDAFYDDVYSIEGHSFLQDKDNNKYEATITTPLQKSTNCRWINHGIMSLNIGEKHMQILHLGNGSCDNTVLVSIDRWSTAIHTLQ